MTTTKHLYCRFFAPYLNYCIIALMALVITSCQRASEGLVGEWYIDQQALANHPKILKVAPPAGILLQEWKKNMTKDWSFRFNADKSLQVIMHGSYYEGRYQITREVGHTVFIQAELKAKPINELDGLLGVPTSEGEVEVKQFSISILGKEGTISLDEMTPLKIIRHSRG